MIDKLFAGKDMSSYIFLNAQSEDKKIDEDRASFYNRDDTNGGCRGKNS